MLYVVLFLCFVVSFIIRHFLFKQETSYWMRINDWNSDVCSSELVAQFLTLMDSLEARTTLVVIAATNRPEAIDESLRRPCRFDREIIVGVPDERGRREILGIHTRGMPLGGQVDLAEDRKSVV